MRKIQGHSQKQVFKRISDLFVPRFKEFASKSYSKNSVFLHVSRRCSRRSAPYRAMLAQVAGFGQNLLPRMSPQANLTAQSTRGTTSHCTRLPHGPAVPPLRRQFFTHEDRPFGCAWARFSGGGGCSFYLGMSYELMRSVGAAGIVQIRRDTPSHRRVRQT